MGIHEIIGAQRIAVEEALLVQITRILESWFRAQNRDLPWRPVDLNQLRDPYAVWISETMLQQTRVEAVISHYERWMQQLPTLLDLANAKEERVLHLWQGLGYYSRARNLHRAALALVQRNEHELPRTPQELLALPGIGAYTAGAILSLAWHQHQPLLDGNLIRIFSRLRCINGLPVESKEMKALYWDIANQFARTAHPHIINEALMEFGAVLCTPRSPLCNQCLLKSHCSAFHQGTVGQYPPAKPKVQPEQINGIVLVCRRDGKLLVHKAPKGLLSKQWRLPWMMGDDRAKLQSKVSCGSFRHAITRYRLTLEVVRIDLESPQQEVPFATDDTLGEWRWIAAKDARMVLVNSLSIKALTLSAHCDQKLN